jgi:hypothetical protein
VLWLHRGTGNAAAPFAARTKVGTGWNQYSQIIGAGDVTGDGRGDLLARDAAGVLWLHRGTGNAAAPFAARTKVGTGWNQYSQIIGAGDVTGAGPTSSSATPPVASGASSGRGSRARPSQSP